jgi:transcriptional regulator
LYFLAERTGTQTDMNRILPKAKPSITIILNDQQESIAPAYTSLDEVSGQVSITAPTHTQFDQICEQLIYLESPYTDQC